MPPKYPHKKLLLSSLSAVILSGCLDNLMEPQLELPLSVAFDASAFMTAGDAYVLLATTNSGKLLEIDVDAGTVRQLGQAQAFEGFKPGWTGITRDASGAFFTSSRTNGDTRSDGCAPFNGGTPCTHIYNIDPATGLINDDLGSTGMEHVSDIDAGAGIMYGSRYDVATDRGQLITISPSGVATAAPNTFSTAATIGIDDDLYLVNGGISVDPNTGVIWGIENKLVWLPNPDGPGVDGPGPRLFTIDGTTGLVTSLDTVTVEGSRIRYGFDALEIMPDGRFFASRASSTPFEIYQIDPTTGAAELIDLPPDAEAVFGATPNGLETTTAPRALALAVGAASVTVEETGNPGGDDLSMDATFALGAGNNGLDLTSEAFIVSIGGIGFTLPAGSFHVVGGVFQHTSTEPGLTLVEVDPIAGTLHVEGAGLTLTSLLGAPKAVILQMGDDVGETTATVTASGGIPPQPAGEFYSVTNTGELLIIDLALGTGTKVGTASGHGWTGLAFSPGGLLYTSTRQRDGSTTDGCDNPLGTEPFPTKGRCAHVYQMDPATGQVLEYIGNTGIQYLSDLQFDADGLLLGIEFINENRIRDGGLVKIDLATGLAARKGRFGSFEDLFFGNGGLALDPATGELWGIESNDLFPRLFRINPITGAALNPPIPLMSNGQVVDFGFDGVAILPDGRFYATRGGGFQEVYRIDPFTGEVRRLELSLPGIEGGLNGLELFVEPSGGPPPPVDIGVRDTFLRRDKAGKSRRSARSEKSEKSGRSGKSGKSDRALDHRRTNEGGNPRLELEQDQDVLVAFDVGDLDFSTVTGARLILTIDPSLGSTGWGRRGGRAEVHYLETDFVEGNGINTGFEAERFRGTGLGATWECGADQDIANNERDCDREDRWRGARDRGRTGDRVQITDDLLGTVSFDVTTDLRDGRAMWAIDVKGRKKGSIVFYSKEGAAVAGDFSFAPRLVITTGG